MAAQARRNDTKLLFLKTARALTYIVYGFMVLAITFLSLLASYSCSSVRIKTWPLRNSYIT